MNCKCQNCPGILDFDRERVGETVECPHCQMETMLFIPVQPSRQMETTPTKKKFTGRHYQVENDLENIGYIFFAIGIIGGVLSFLGLCYCVVFHVAGYGLGEEALGFLFTMLAAVAQGWIIRALFCAPAQIIRQLKALNSNRANP